MKNVALVLSVLIFAFNSYSETLKLDADLQKKIDLCGEQDKKAAESDFVKFLENKKMQALVKYLRE